MIIVKANTLTALLKKFTGIWLAALSQRKLQKFYYSFNVLFYVLVCVILQIFVSKFLLY